MTTSMIRKAKNLDDKIHANMNKAYAILQAMRALHNEEAEWMTQSLVICCGPHLI